MRASHASGLEQGARRSEVASKSPAVDPFSFLHDDVFISVDHDARIVTVSCDGSAPHELHGLDLWSLLQLNEPASESYRSCFEQRIRVTFFEQSSDSQRHRQARAYPAANGGMHIFLHDVTSFRVAEQEARKRAELEQQLIGIVSHDLRNPLQVIRFAAVQGLRGPGDKERDTRFFERIVAASDRAVRMTDDLLDFTRIRFLGSVHLEPRLVDLHELTAHVVSELISARPERSVELERVGDGHGTWDADRLAQVVQNLVGNALQHTTEGTSIHVKVSGDTDHVTLTVHNGGPPIPAADQPHIFEPFQRGKGARTSGRSLGLGLHITSHIVQAHGGAVSLRSTAEAGTTFTVRLPRTSTRQKTEETDDASRPAHE